MASDQLTRSDPVRVCRNPRVGGRAEVYRPARAQALSTRGFDEAFGEIASWPGYEPMPLVSLHGLAKRLRLGELWYKNERGRFGLGSFKALGGAYALARVLAAEVRRRGGATEVSSRDLASGRFRAITGDVTVTSATDGNHGRSVAWGAQLFGCRCVIYIHATVSEARAAAIARYGAEVVRVRGNYDDAVRHADEQARTNGWVVVQDTAFGDYRDIPLDVTHGYGVIAHEIMQQMPEPPTHAFVQAGVGALASAICADFWIGWGTRRPFFVVVEPTKADCVLRSVAAGRPVTVGGDIETAMAGLACGEVSELAWDVLRTGVDACVAIDDGFALDAVRALANPAAGDPSIVAGETGAAGLGALLAVHDDETLRRQLALDAGSRVLLIGSEGDTDPDIYRRIVGRTAAEVLAT